MWPRMGWDKGMESRIKGGVRGKDVLDHMELCRSEAIYLLCAYLLTCKQCEKSSRLFQKGSDLI